MDNDQRGIIAKLAKDHCYGKHHITEQNLLKGTQKHLQGEQKNALNQLVKQNYVIKHPTKNGWAYSLNPRKIKEIQELINSA
jgi:hypothetical protein